MNVPDLQCAHERQACAGRGYRIQRLTAPITDTNRHLLRSGYEARNSSEPAEIPMAPITMLRNALGVAEGGSGVPLDRAAYLRAVEYWNTHANWR